MRKCSSHQYGLAPPPVVLSLAPSYSRSQRGFPTKCVLTLRRKVAVTRQVLILRFPNQIRNIKRAQQEPEIAKTSKELNHI
ncbi:hypothetical protein NDU88_002506 [Pleurodeles waltl]|uniref:Uncharacterized protein n=1 Tax=Pleurodeles waltl TaxID=8319 RepID=A0AAV7NDX4_PLEWA|nr:hypothetical protein NDU88_002506 [Pleurodeles waltl]